MSWDRHEVYNQIEESFKAKQALNPHGNIHPPCHSCVYWYPVPVVTIKPINGPYMTNFRLCHADSMFKDFSCYCQRIIDIEEDDLQDIPF